ncbi:MAG: arginine biosynthesis bifunctional protein ArgJ [Pirellulaceae bacterium]|nr:MAG: arginine biosynthesis bifunctional protein ArgJ [Pirellulaceae bacterium]
MDLQLPRGFRYAGVACGIKKRAGKRDLALIVAEQNATCAGVYTRNQVVAAPVVLCRQRTPGDSLRAVVINSGNANACTGRRGDEDAVEMTRLVARALGRGIDPSQVLVMSTGVIGHYLPMEKIAVGIERAAHQLGDQLADFTAAAEGILTTDKGIKIGCRTLATPGGRITLAGMAKGAGMIGPNMATMLGCILTDARLDPDQAQRLLQAVADVSFNCISVEGHTSTNDTLILMASGASSTSPLRGDAEYQFVEELKELCIELAKQIPADGEGAAHLIEVAVAGAPTDEQAREVARTVASSNLVKTAIYGNDPNWGRIVSAAGYAPVAIDPRKLTLRLNGVELFRGGEPVPFDAAMVSQSMRENAETRVELQVGNGPGKGWHWSSDLTVEYVRFNSEYTT